MKRIIVTLIVSLTVSFAVSQRSVDLEQDIFFTQSFDPSIEMDKTYARFTFNPQYNKIGANVNFDNTAVGLYTEQERFGSEYNVYLSQRAGRFVGSIQVGYYEFEGRSATTGGFSLVYNHARGFLGVKVRDLFDVPYNSSGTTDVFFYYEAMTPEFIFFQELFKSDGMSFRTKGSASFQDVVGFEFNAVAEVLINDTFRLGGGMGREDLFGYIAKDWGNVALFASFGRNKNVGVNFKIN